MSTRLTNQIKADVEKSLRDILSLGYKFLDCPLTNEELVAFWEENFPADYHEAVSKVLDYGADIRFETRSERVGFHVQTEKGIYEIRLANPNHERMYLKFTGKMYERRKLPLVRSPVSGSLSVNVNQSIVLTPNTIVERLGQQKAIEFMEWVEGFALLDRDIQKSTIVINDLLGMVKTAGQLRRMVPDLMRYIPAEQRAALDDQKRASTLPFEWAAYDRASVDTLLATLLKCSLLKGFEKPRMRHACVDGDNFNWARLVDGATIEFQDDIDEDEVGE